MSHPRQPAEVPASSAIVETLRLSRPARDQLITLKRRTGIENWNVLCRWALCISLAEPTRPRDVTGVSADGGIEMTWRTFAGDNELVYAALVRQRCLADGLPSDAETLARQLRLHLHRGIAYLVGSPRLNHIAELVRTTCPGD